MRDGQRLTEGALRVLRARYLLRDEGRRVIETPAGLFHRVASAIGAAGRRCDGGDHAEAYEEMLASLDFLPNSPTLMNAGTERSQLSACFVLPVEDTMEGIFESLKRMALIQRTGGGTGFSFSRLRPRGALVRTTGGKASGPVSFLRIFDGATEHIRQGGRRRGANMGVLRVDHPDILEFVRLKSDGCGAANFNLSVGVTDAFMEAVEAGRDISLHHPRTGCAEVVPATDLFNGIAQAAWACGDPGLVFLDAVNRANPTPHLGRIEATNPCGEIPLLPYEACNLGSLNLTHMLAGGVGGRSIDWAKLERTVRLAVRFLDDVIEAGEFPFEEIDRLVRGNRKIGLGVMGFAEMLILLGVPYDSEEAVELAGRLMEFIAAAAGAASEELAARRKVFPNWPGSVHEAAGRRVRHATCTSIAPTGTIGIIAGTSGGIEPLFALAFRRSHTMGGERLSEVNALFRGHAADLGPVGERLLEHVRRCGVLAGAEDVPAATRSLFATALEIPADRHLDLQAAFQRHVDNAVSKTINLPTGTSPEEIARIYRRAWELGLKGITVYRYDSKPDPVLEFGTPGDPLPPENPTRCGGSGSCPG